MVTIIPYLVSIFLAILDGSSASLFVIIPLLLCSHIIISKIQGCNNVQRDTYWIIVSLVYMISGFIFSNSFEEGNYHIVFDPSHYIADFINNQQYYDGSIWKSLLFSYLDLSDNNILYYILLVQISAIGAQFGGTTVFTLTALQIGFGIMTCSIMYRIISKYSTRVYNYALTYALLSFTLFYSSIIIRDILIAFFYAFAIDIVLEKFRIKGVLTLCVLIIFTLGIRLYSGIFLILILVYYITNRLYFSKLKFIVLSLGIIVALFSIGYLSNSHLVNQTKDELELYSELSNENSSGGLVSMFMTLPLGIRHLSITLFTMIRPIPPHAFFLKAETFSDYFMSVIFTIEFIWWYIIFYITLLGLIIKKYYQYITSSCIGLFLIATIFLLINSSHPDIRRMMPMFPAIYLIYIQIMDRDRKSYWIIKYRSILICLYIILSMYSLVNLI